MKEDLVKLLRKALICISEFIRLTEEDDQKKKDNFQLVKFNKKNKKKD